MKVALLGILLVAASLGTLLASTWVCMKGCIVVDLKVVMTGR